MATLAMPATPLNDVTNNLPMESVEKMPAAPPPPPPLAEEAAAAGTAEGTAEPTTDSAEPLHKKLMAKVHGTIPVSLLEDRHASKLVLLASAHIALALVYLVNVSLLAPLLWFALATVMFNGARSLCGAPPPPRAPITKEQLEESLVPHLVHAANLVQSWAEDVLEVREPRRALGAATAFWLVAQLSTYLSMGKIALLAVDAAALVRIAGHTDAVEQKLHQLYVSVKQTEAMRKAMEVVGKIETDLKWVGAVGLFLVWSLCCGLFNKALTIGFVVLALKASGTAAGPSVKEGVATIQRTARRMSVSAGNLLSPYVKKTKAM